MQLGGCGASAVLVAEHAELAQSRYATDAAAAAAVAAAAGCAVIVAPMTSRWARVLPGVALRLGGRVDTHVTGLAAAGGGVGSHAVVLSPADGGHPAAHRAAVGVAARSGRVPGLVGPGAAAAGDGA